MMRKKRVEKEDGEKSWRFLRLTITNDPSIQLIIYNIQSKTYIRSIITTITQINTILHIINLLKYKLIYHQNFLKVGE